MIKWSLNMTTKKSVTIAATQFKAHCLELMDRVQRTGIEITVTKHGKPVARLVPASTEKKPFFGALPVISMGDLIAPIDSEWEADA